MDLIKITEKKALGIEEYNGSYSIVEYFMGANETWYKTWCYPVIKGKPGDKMFPSGPWLGKDDKKALEILEGLCSIMRGLMGQAIKQTVVNDDDDIPF